MLTFGNCLTQVCITGVLFNFIKGGFYRQVSCSDDIQQKAHADLVFFSNGDIFYVKIEKHFQ